MALVLRKLWKLWILIQWAVRLLLLIAALHVEVAVTIVAWVVVGAEIVAGVTVNTVVAVVVTSSTSIGCIVGIIGIMRAAAAARMRLSTSYSSSSCACSSNPVPTAAAMIIPGTTGAIVVPAALTIIVQAKDTLSPVSLMQKLRSISLLTFTFIMIIKITIIISACGPGPVNSITSFSLAIDTKAHFMRGATLTTIGIIIIITNCSCLPICRLLFDIPTSFHFFIIIIATVVVVVTAVVAVNEADPHRFLTVTTNTAILLHILLLLLFLSL
jgi:hypothetical protein